MSHFSASRMSTETPSTVISQSFSGHSLGFFSPFNHPIRKDFFFLTILAFEFRAVSLLGSCLPHEPCLQTFLLLLFFRKHLAVLPRPTWTLILPPYGLPIRHVSLCPAYLLRGGLANSLLRLAYSCVLPDLCLSSGCEPLYRAQE
jgi:hypothetical protein